MIAPLIMCILGTFLWWQFQGPESVEPEKRIPIPRITISFIEQVIDQTISTANTTVQTVPLTDTDEVTTNTQEASSETLIETTETPETMQAETQIENATAQTTEPSSCSSPDALGLSNAFERELAIFLNNAAATYGSQYSDLQYSISNQSISQDASQATVSANYQGSVTEITTGESISASGGMSVNFSWDGCQWLLVDYSYF